MVRKNNELTVAFAGDICLGMGMSDIIRENGTDYLFENVGPYFGQADLRVGNLECCLIDSSFSDYHKKQLMAVPLDTAKVLDKNRFDILGLANNHILDCGIESLVLARKYLDQEGIVYFGAGLNINEAIEIAYINVNGRVIAFLGFGDTTRYYAGNSKAGIAPLSRKLMAEQIGKAKRRADLVIVSLHADMEFTYYPSTWRVKLSRWLIEQGADIIAQHHPHVMQGIEQYKQGLIAYSLGNFIFNWNGSEYLCKREGVADSFILNVTVNFTENKPQFLWQVIPVNIDLTGKPHVLKNEKARPILQHMKKLSNDLKDNKRLRKEWRRRCYRELKNESRLIYWMLLSCKFNKVFDRIATVINNPELRRWITGLISLGSK